MAENCPVTVRNELHGRYYKYIACGHFRLLSAIVAVASFIAFVVQPIK